MADPYLADDETIILAAEHIRVRSKEYPALILTNRRLLLIRSAGEAISVGEYPLDALRSALVSQAPRDDPSLLLTYVTPRGDLRREIFSFTGTPEQRRADEVREWAKKLSATLKPLVKDEGILTESPPGGASAATAAGTPLPSREIPESRGRSSKLVIPDISDILEPAKPPASPARRIIPVAAILVVIAVLAGIFFLSHATSEANTDLPVPSIPATPVPAATAVTITTVPVTEITSPLSGAGVSGTDQFVIPSTGVWIRIRYSGNFTGSVGSGSVMIPVAGSGDHFYHQAVTTGSIRAFVEKEDGSGNKLSVDIYQDGAIVADGHGETTKPFGGVNIQIGLRTADTESS